MKTPVSIILPTYNEAGHIVPLVESLRKKVPQAQVLVVDDQSPDGTAQRIAESFGGDGMVRLIERRGPRGLAESIGEGIEAASGEKIVIMDTDFSHDPDVVPVMLSNLTFFDLVSGSRYIYGGGMYSEIRYFFSYLFNQFSRYLLNTRLTDHLSGFAAFRRNLLERIFERVSAKEIFHGYGDYYIRFLFHAVRCNAKILEVPSWYRDREYGESKTRFLRTLARYTAAVLGLRIRYGRAWRRRWRE